MRCSSCDITLKLKDGIGLLAAGLCGHLIVRCYNCNDFVRVAMGTTYNSSHGPRIFDVNTKLATAENKGDRIKNSLLYVVLHQFGQHDGFGDWCQMKNKPTAKHRNLLWGAHLKDENMKKDLLKVFTDLDPGELGKLDSSNPNESFNNTVRSKAPKDKHYSKSRSLVHRFSAAVCQKIEGYKYVAQVHKELGLSPGIATTVTAAIRHKDVNRKRTVAKTK